MNCPICNSNKIIKRWLSEVDFTNDISFNYTFSPKNSKTLGVALCNNCTHEFCSPIPQDFARNYEDVVDNEYLKHSNSREKTAEKILTHLKRIKPHGRLIDIGCATGDFLNIAKTKSNYDVFGLEPSIWASTIALNRGLRIHQEFLENFSSKNPIQFDIVTCWGVIEHFVNPKKETINMVNILKPGGILALWTGDVSSITSRLLGRRWWYWQGQHIQYFSKKSLRKLLLDSGFSEIDFKIYPFSMNYRTLENSLRRYKFSSVILTILKPLFLIFPNLYWYIPGEMFVIAVKRDTH